MLAYGLVDWGLLAPGYGAGVGVVGFEALGLTRSEVVRGLSARGERLEIRSAGYLKAFPSGVEVAAAASSPAKSAQSGGGGG